MLNGNRQPVYTLAMLLLGTIVGVGCSNDGMIHVQGQVTVDGEALGQGAINFESADGKGPSGGGVIEDGKYDVQVTPGLKIVRISGSQLVGSKPIYPDQPNGPKTNIYASVVPDRYNAKSELELMVESSPTIKDFNLESKKR